MTILPSDVSAEAESAKALWHRFLDVFEPLRPELYRYCRALTRSAWDAEDLVQDTLARGLVTLGCLFQEVENPKAWLFRVASNLWIDRERRRRAEPRADASAVTETRPNTGLETREAGATLISLLSPQERAAVLLKDVFDFTIDETATILTTSPNAIKSALHRGRVKLSEPALPVSRSVSAAVLDAFCEAFNARDIDRLVALMLDSATADIAGIATEYGPRKMRQSDTGSLYHSLFTPISHAVAPELLEGYRGGVAHAERLTYRDEPVIVHWYDHDDGRAVRDVLCLTTEGERVAAMRSHFFSPDVLSEVCRELGLPWKSNGYRYWTKAP